MLETANISEIVTILKTAGLRLIGIDGRDGSGKSTLASSLSKELGCPHVNIDGHIDKNLGQYVNHVHYDGLQRRIDEGKGLIIIEGICLLAIFENIQRRFDILIYVKRVSAYGIWQDEDDCDVSEDINDFIDKKKEELQNFVWAEACIEGKDVPDGVNFPELVEEVIRYHYEYCPHKKADIIYKRIV
jgi:uridine kinase